MSGKAPSQRQLRVGEMVRHALSDVLIREPVAEPGLDTTQVSISEVRMSPDLKIATAYVAPLAVVDGEGDAKALSQALARHARYLRGRITPHLRGMRSVPTFRFLPDTSFDNYARIDALLRSPAVARDLDSKDED